MNLLGLVTLPVRVTVAATQVTLGLGQLAAAEGPLRRKGGYADQVTAVFGAGGVAEQLARVLQDPQGPLSALTKLAEALEEDRPLGKAIAPGGPLERIIEEGVLERFASRGGPMDRLLAEGGALERVLAPGGPLDRLLVEGGALDRITQTGGALELLLSPGGPLDRLLAENGALDRITHENGLLELLLREQGLADRLLAEDGFVEKLTADGGTLDQLLHLGDVLKDLQQSVLVLNRAVEPLGELANRVPNSLLRRKGAGPNPQIINQ
ncbi:ABC transporter [Rhodococcus sp. X156]|uniref:ABC transporter n=1 Tax=Rhodococcus sp. X156 TaxID=2499145 RepID=UPI000FD84EEC|nr:ABC transporter [Rhodococcus sp. X156]